MEIKIKKLHEDSIIPTRGSEYAAGYDLYAATDGPVRIPAHRTILVGTGLSMALPQGTFLGVYPRSGLACKQGLRPANCVGVVDSDYRGEIMVPLHNHSNQTATIEPKERIAQMVITPFLTAQYTVVEELSDTVRGESGFGSTGRK